jgi:uncharacterized RDD family membrane protein YckC
MFCKNHPDVVDNLTQCSGCEEYFCSDCLVQLKGKMLCGHCKGEAVKDIQSGVPVGGSDLVLATIWARFVALFVDGLVMMIPVVGVTFGLTFLLVGAVIETDQRQLTIVFQLLIGLLATIPFIVYEGLMLSSRGQTLGKMAMGIKVVTPEGQDITAGQAWGRAVIRHLLNMFRLLGALINYLPAFGKERACLHDRIMKTRVIKIR